jgi:hypothetical protein
LCYLGTLERTGQSDVNVLRRRVWLRGVM